jgi:HemY protein
MLRLIVLLGFITALSLGASWLADEPGRVVIDWSNYHVKTSLLVIIAAIAGFSLGFMILYALFYTLIRTPRIMLRSRLQKRQSLGLNALTDSFAALATQDVMTAKRHIGRAQYYLPHQPLTLMLSAQIARLEGNDSQARLYLEQMLKAESTEFIAMRGLIENARRSHDDTLALEYAEKAIALKPQDGWLITLLAGLYTTKGKTQQALQLLENASSKRYIDRELFRRLSAYVLYENAKILAEQKRWDFAIAILEDSIRKAPGFAPASALLAEAYAKQNEMKQALKVVSASWKITSHPLLTGALLTFYEMDKERKKVISTIEKLAVIHHNDRESQFLTAELAIKRSSTDMARRYLEQLLSTETKRACLLMAEIETAEGNTEQATHWLKRASSAAPDSSYICENCNYSSDEWQLICSKCSSVASSVWR